MQEVAFWIPPLLGGALIGLSVSLMLWLNGRVVGISGIANGLLTFAKGDMLWRVMFVLGLVVGGFAMRFSGLPVFESLEGVAHSRIALAGVLVGFGTIMGSGCTSGHGICGMARLSPRSIVATATFMAAGIIVVYIVRHLWGA